MKRNRSLGRRLSLWLALQGLAGMAAICAAVYLDARSNLAARQVDALATKLVQVKHLIVETSRDASLDTLRHKLNDLFVGHDEVALRIQAADGLPIYASNRLVTPKAAGRTVEFTVPRARPDGSALNVQLHLDTRDDELLLRRLGTTLILAAIGGAVLASLSGYALVRIGLGPVRSLADAAGTLAADTLKLRLSSANQPEELRPLVDQFNGLLGRLDAAYDQLQGFNSDVAHELCTPLATLISSSELALRRAQSGAELVDVIGSNLEELRRLAGIVQDMLFLSQADRGARARRTPVDSLAQIARSVADYHEADIAAAGLQLEIVGEASGAFDVPLMRRALSNLLFNATRYAQAGSTVSIQIQRNLDAGSVQVSVRDQGVQIAPEDLPRIFDRFYRADKARPATGNTHGLGLSIVWAIARMHEGSVFAQSDERCTEVGMVLMAPVPELPGAMTPHSPEQVVPIA